VSQTGAAFWWRSLALAWTDKEINDAEYGAAPEGCDFLLTGHESFGRVVEVGPNVRGLEPGDEEWYSEVACKSAADEDKP
jgi:D-arabinose 1-dehydrogenase-like Zn-dependent alcohol dehydrogenase